MRIALVKPPATYADWYKRPVLGLAFLSACLEAQGHECRIFDAYFSSWSEGDLCRRVQEFDPKVIGITSMTHEIVSAARIAAELKKNMSCSIVIGGCHVTTLPERTLKEFNVFDYGIQGEGERTFLELNAHLSMRDNFEPSSVKGLVYRSGNEICVNEPAAFLTSEELDSLPLPAFHHYYGKNPRALADKESCYTMLTSRGCPYRCAFCMQVLGNKIRRRSAENVCREIEFAIATYGAHSIDFVDEIFLFNTQETHELLEMMIKNGLHKRIRWSGLVRANFVNPELIALAKKAGCYRLEMGVESGDDTILKAINKGITIEQIRVAVKIIKEAGISLGTYYILGHPNETPETIRKTVNLASELNTDTIAVGIMVPYPGTRIFEMAQRGEGGYRLLSQDWSEYDKYGARALEIQGLPYKELVKWQRKALIKLYIRNFRFMDAFRYFWQRRSALVFLFKKYIARLAKEA